MNNDLAKQIYEVAHLTGEFKLRSGQISHEYFDKYRFEAQPKILAQIAKAFGSLVKEYQFDALAGLETGGIPLATALSLEIDSPTCFVRKEAKNYGTCQFAEGLEIKDKHLLVVEDVVTTGGQLIQSIQDLRSAGAKVTQAVCVIMRGEEHKIDAIFKEQDIELLWLFKKSDFDGL